LRPLGITATNKPIVPFPDDYDVGEIDGMMIEKGNQSILRKTYPSAALSTTNPYACLDANPGRREASD
jgi:hypothetical protein